MVCEFTIGSYIISRWLDTPSINNKKKLKKLKHKTFCFAGPLTDLKTDYNKTAFISCLQHLRRFPVYLFIIKTLNTKLQISPDTQSPRSLHTALTCFSLSIKYRLTWSDQTLPYRWVVRSVLFWRSIYTTTCTHNTHRRRWTAKRNDKHTGNTNGSLCTAPRILIGTGDITRVPLWSYIVEAHTRRSATHSLGLNSYTFHQRPEENGVPLLGLETGNRTVHDLRSQCKWASLVPLPVGGWGYF